MISNHNSTTCLGIDPGIGKLGYGIVTRSGHYYRVRDYGCVETPPHTDLCIRIKMIYDDIRYRIEKWDPEIISIEKLFFGRNTTTAGNVWQARGTILLLAAQYDIDYVEPKPNQIKLAVCGNGRADKHQIQRMLQKLLCLDELPRPDDAADALAISLTGLSLYSFNRKTR